MNGTANTSLGLTRREALKLAVLAGIGVSGLAIPGLAMAAEAEVPVSELPFYGMTVSEYFRTIDQKLYDELTDDVKVMVDSQYMYEVSNGSGRPTTRAAVNGGMNLSAWGGYRSIGFSFVYSVDRTCSGLKVVVTASRISTGAVAEYPTFYGSGYSVSDSGTFTGLSAGGAYSVVATGVPTMTRSGDSGGLAQSYMQVTVN